MDQPPRLADRVAALAAAFPETRVSLAVGGAQLACRRAGVEGPVVLLLHGISSGAASWFPCATLLAAHARVIAWDAPGYGASTPLHQASPRAGDYAARLAALVAALGVRPDLIVGHSLGALMAAAYLARAAPQERPSTVLLLSPAQGYGTPAHARKAQEVARQRLEALAVLGVSGLAERGPDRLLSAGADASAKEWVRWNMSRLDAHGYRQAVAMLCGDDIAAYLQRLPTEVAAAVACGTRDVVTPPTGTEVLARRFRLRFTPIEEAGHACYIERAEAVAQWIRAALDERRPR